MELMRMFPADAYAHALESWAWLDIAGKAPIFASPFGDVCLRDGAGFWWLDLLDGTLSLAWESSDQLRAELDTETGQDRYLLAGLAWAAELRGVVPTDDEVYAFTVPPVIGGPIDVDHIQVMNFVAIVGLTGQIHQQIRDLPPDARVTGLSVDDSGSVWVVSSVD